jgi:hypothetical protein
MRALERVPVELLERGRERVDARATGSDAGTRRELEARLIQQRQELERA